MRERLLSEILWFVPKVARLSGVRRIALLGSMTTEKKDPKDIDFLVVVDDEVSLEPLAKIGRKVKGHAQNIGRGADIFLTNARGGYIGRTLARRLGKSRAYVTKLLRGTTNFTLESLVRIGHALSNEVEINLVTKPTAIRKTKRTKKRPQITARLSPQRKAPQVR